MHAWLVRLAMEGGAEVVLLRFRCAHAKEASAIRKGTSTYGIYHNYNKEW